MEASLEELACLGLQQLLPSPCSVLGLGLTVRHSAVGVGVNVPGPCFMAR